MHSQKPLEPLGGCQHTGDTLPGAPVATETPDDIVAWRKRWGWKIPHPSQDYRSQLKAILAVPNPVL